LDCPMEGNAGKQRANRKAQADLYRRQRKGLCIHEQKVIANRSCLTAFQVFQYNRSRGILPGIFFNYIRTNPVMPDMTTTEIIHRLQKANFTPEQANELASILEDSKEKSKEL